MGHIEIPIEELIGNRDKNKDAYIKIASGTKSKNKEKQQLSYADMVVSGVVTKNKCRSGANSMEKRRYFQIRRICL